MMEMRSNDVPELKAWLDKKRGNYIHSDIQNELLRIMAHRILREHVLKPIQNGSCISSNHDLWAVRISKESNNNLNFCYHFLEGM